MRIIRRDTSDSPSLVTTLAKNFNRSSQQNILHPTHYLKIMKNGRERLRTFTEGRWPVSAQQSPIDLAEAGFFYLGQLDRVQCAFCKTTLKNWVRGEVPILEHYKRNQHCDFIKGYEVGNVPISEDPVRSRNTIFPNFDVVGNCNSLTRNLDPMPQVSTSEYQHLSSDEENNRMDLESLNDCSQPFGPQCPEMASYDARLSTFRTINWPANFPIQTTDLADAGLFYVGQEDHVKCFYCSGGIYGWESGDEPWSEHQRLFPHCTYVQLNMALNAVATHPLR